MHIFESVYNFYIQSRKSNQHKNKGYSQTETVTKTISKYDTDLLGNGLLEKITSRSCSNVSEGCSKTSIFCIWRQLLECELVEYVGEIYCILYTASPTYRKCFAYIHFMAVCLNTNHRKLDWRFFLIFSLINQAGHRIPKYFTDITTARLKLQVNLIPSLSETKINERSLVKLYERTKTAITAPMYTASFFPGSRFPDVLREMTSSFWINKPPWAIRFMT